jgi:hypothetical protein
MLTILVSVMSSRKCLSGKKNSKRQLKDELVEAQKGPIDNFFRTSSSSRDPLELAIVSVEEQLTENRDATNDYMNDGDNNSSQQEKLKT